MSSQNMIQWIFASIAAYFEENKGDYLLTVEGDQLDISDVDFWVDLQVNKFEATQLGRRRWRYECDILVIVNEAPVGTDAYRVQRAAGYFMSYFSSIPIFNDEEELIGCLRFQNPILVNYYGTGSNLAQATVTGHFQMSYEETA